MNNTGNLSEDILKHLTLKNKQKELDFSRGRISSWTYSQEKNIKLYDKDYKGYIVPQQYLNTCYDGEPIVIDEEKKITLRPEQEKLMQDIRELKSKYGTIIAHTGFGKTIIMSYMIRKLKEKTLVLVPTIAIAVQTVETFIKYGMDTGLVGGGKKEIDKDVVVMVGASFGKQTKRNIDKMKFRMLLVDECDKFLTDKLVKNIIRVPANFVYGFTATPVTNRFHKKDDVFGKLFGPRVTAPSLQLKPQVWYYEYSPNYTIKAENYTKDRNKILDQDVDRMYLMKDIVKDLAVNHGRKHILVLFDRIKAVHEFSDLFWDEHGPVINQGSFYTIVGSMNTDDREKQKKIFTNEGGVLVATDQTVGRGFDVSKIDTVCLFFPNKFDGRIIQMVGRALRKCEGKLDPLVVDFAESSIKHQWNTRRRVYRSEYCVLPILKKLPNEK